MRLGRRWNRATTNPLDDHRAGKDERDEASQVLCASIQSFKGMESDVVFVTEMAKVHPDQAVQMWYTACSRARHRLCIFDLEKAD